ncbi:MAG: hypothetical protein LBQ43_05310 [Holosporales bacterium]|jgi:hypothetical protein|nr:hypothetical protein [Holosporales bacterium]
MILNNYVTKGALLKRCALLFLCSVGCGGAMQAYSPDFAGLEAEAAYRGDPANLANIAGVTGRLIFARNERLDKWAEFNKLVVTLWGKAARKASIRHSTTPERVNEFNQIEQELAVLNQQRDNARTLYNQAVEQHHEAALAYREAVRPYDVAVANQLRKKIDTDMVIEKDIRREEFFIMLEEHDIMCEDETNYGEHYDEDDEYLSQE